MKALVEARALSDALFATLTPEAWLARPVAERHRLLFYLGHVEAFDWNLLVREPSRNARYEQLFAFGIDPLDDVPRDRPEDWPPLDDVRAWIAKARADVDAAPTSEHDAAQSSCAFIALEHRLMHVETLTYLFEQLEPGLRVVPTLEVRESVVPAQRWLRIPRGVIHLGLERDAGVLGWCNEFEGHDVEVPAFEIEARKTTNADWLAFIEAGGYREASFWNDDDQAWRAELDAPLSWARGRPPLSWPVYVSHAEASAYAKFRGARLPTEAQWHRAVHGTESGGMRAFPWGDAAPRPGVHGNFAFKYAQPTSVGAHPAGASAFGLDEPVGNGWEWTSSAFAPFPGFQKLAHYPGYSEPFFDGRHFILAGASKVTALPLLRRSFRNWYQPHYRAGFATVRLSRDVT